MGNLNSRRITTTTRSAISPTGSRSSATSGVSTTGSNISSSSSHGGSSSSRKAKSCRHVAMVFLPALFIILYQAGLVKRIPISEYLSNEIAVVEERKSFGPIPIERMEDGMGVPQGNVSLVATPAPNSFQLPPRNRTITLVHVGKAGGMTLRRITSLICRLSRKKYDTPEKMEGCIRLFVPPKSVLANSLIYYFHMYAYNASELRDSTSFLFPLRNPVDRIISNFRYSHPANCPDERLFLNPALRPWGCQSKKNSNNTRYPTYWTYNVCFPSAAMEEFAQNVLSPFPDANQRGYHFAKLDFAQQQQCRWLARQFIQGYFKESPGPHMRYNYEYYRNLTLLVHPHKEIFGIRTSNEWEDMKSLDIAMGGNGIFRGKEGASVSHGSEGYEPSPLTTEAYHKLCCVLEHEIGVYGDILNHVMNLNTTVKQEMMDEVRQKCGIEPQVSLDLWSRQCQKRLEADRVELEPYSLEKMMKKQTEKMMKKQTRPSERRRSVTIPPRGK